MKASQACLAGFHCQNENGVFRLMCLYLAELSRLSVDLIGTKPSLIAAAIVYLARVTIGIREDDKCHKVDEKGYWTKTLLHYTGYNVGQIKDTVLSIHKNQFEAEKAEHLNAPFTKYKRSSCRYVSLKTVPSKEILGF
jgi:Cyclin, C-terminal domain